MNKTVAALALVLAAACSRERIDVTGVVVGSVGLPVEGATVVVVGHSAVSTDAEGRFVVPDVYPPYDVLVGLTQPTFERAFAAGWLGLHRPDPVLALANGWPQAGARSASVCGSILGNVSFPSTAPWVLIEPRASHGNPPMLTHVDPGSRTFCAGAGWTGAATTSGIVHVLGVDSVGGSGSDFSATGFPAAGTLAGLSLVDGAHLTGGDVALAPAESAALAIEATGPGVPGANLFVSAYYGDSWPGGGVPLASQLSGQPWPSVAVPVLADVRVRVIVWSSNTSGGTWRERSLTPSAATASLDLPAIPEMIEPAAGSIATVGTRFRWGPAEKGAVFVLSVTGNASVSSPLTGLVVYGAAPDLRLPDFAQVGVGIPNSTTGSFEARSVGPLAGIDALATMEHLGLAMHNGLGEDEWGTASTTSIPVSFGP